MVYIIKSEIRTERGKESLVHVGTTKTQSDSLLTQIFFERSYFGNTKFSNAIEIRIFSTKLILNLYSEFGIT